MTPTIDNPPSPEAVDKVSRYEFSVVRNATVHDGSGGYCVQVVLTPTRGDDREAQRVTITLFSACARWLYAGPPWKRGHADFYREAVSLAFTDEELFGRPAPRSVDETAKVATGQARLVTPDPPVHYCPECSSRIVWRQHSREGGWAWRRECRLTLGGGCDYREDNWAE